MYYLMSGRKHMINKGKDINPDYYIHKATKRMRANVLDKKTNLTFMLSDAAKIAGYSKNYLWKMLKGYWPNVTQFIYIVRDNSIKPSNKPYVYYISPENQRNVIQKKVIDTKTGVIYSSAVQAHRFTNPNIDYSTFCKHIRLKTTYFRYI